MLHYCSMKIYEWNMHGTNTWPAVKCTWLLVFKYVRQPLGCSHTFAVPAGIVDDSYELLNSLLVIIWNTCQKVPITVKFETIRLHVNRPGKCACRDGFHLLQVFVLLSHQIDGLPVVQWEGHLSFIPIGNFGPEIWRRDFG